MVWPASLLGCCKALGRPARAGRDGLRCCGPSALRPGLPSDAKLQVARPEGPGGRARDGSREPPLASGASVARRAPAWQPEIRRGAWSAQGIVGARREPSSLFSGSPRLRPRRAGGQRGASARVLPSLQPDPRWRPPIHHRDAPAITQPALPANAPGAASSPAGGGPPHARRPPGRCSSRGCARYTRRWGWSENGRAEREGRRGGVEAGRGRARASAGGTRRPAA